MSKFAQIDSLAPTINLPISSADYLVGDYVSIPETGTAKVTTAQIPFRPIVYDFTGLDYNINAIDTLYLVIKTTNACPMQLQYLLAFSDVKLNSTILAGGTLDVAGHVTASTEKTTQFLLNNADFRKFNQATKLTLSIILIQPGSGTVIANELKSGKISVKISYKASINLLKL